MILDARGKIMDGYHRVAKALLLKRSWVRAVQFEVTPTPDEQFKDVDNG